MQGDQGDVGAQAAAAGDDGDDAAGQQRGGHHQAGGAGGGLPRQEVQRPAPKGLADHVQAEGGGQCAGADFPNSQRDSFFLSWSDWGGRMVKRPARSGRNRAKLS